MKSTEERLLQALKSAGPQTAATLAAGCAITPMGAHKSLKGLQAQGLVEAFDEVGTVGRPKRIWQLSAAGHSRFPDRHAELFAQMLSFMEPATLDGLIARREAQMQQQYGTALAGAKTLAERVHKLAEQRAAEGYMARAEKQGRDWLLIEDHCPICAAAAACQGFCRSELELFRTVLGPGVEVQRTEHLPAGARRCVYRIGAGPR
ncbi:MAG: transcriptional regulator [Paucibacter sp.]|nr:transcriptional regulator [Roseateles sp.]